METTIPLAVFDAVPVHISWLMVAVQVKSKSPSTKVYELPVWATMLTPLTVPVHV